MEKKIKRLYSIIRRYRSAVIAFSGGVDSTLLAQVAAEVLGKRVLLVTAVSSAFPRSEQAAAKSCAEWLRLPQRIIVSEETAIAGFSDNTPERCYLCKRALFSKMRDIAARKGYAAVFDGSNADDAHDYRPGKRALGELGIISPLARAGLTKSDVRLLSSERRLPTAHKASFACLASRFPYGDRITISKLRRVDVAEAAVRRLGFGQFRIRSHGDCARIEMNREQIERAWKMRGALGRACKGAGFVFTAVDTDGYRTGAMNEALGRKDVHGA